MMPRVCGPMAAAMAAKSGPQSRRGATLTGVPPA